ncbi:hypothetical protein Rhe02_81200 [Rhizocola hellebori]|uniref:SAF domain-containing protein n=2 Tax=Rhizocola hellebori TaxID=1392758 RepID=A0A8J3QFL6_9ACTN|nr:hypothetical protein Rhe02_81200 [Rhizocola hellebori]
MPRSAQLRQGPAGALVPKRRVPLLVGGLLLVLLCAGVFALMQMSRDASVAVLAVARPVAAGQQLTTADLRIAHVVPDPSVPLVRAADLPQVTGRSTAVPLSEGSLLALSQLGPPAYPQQGQAVVAVAIKPGRAPARLSAGAAVRVVTIVKDTGSTTPPPAANPVAAVVVDMSPTVDGTGTRVVSLLLAEADATRIAAAGSDLALILVGIPS